MRTKLLAAFLTIFAIGALGVGPAGAAAKTVTLQNKVFEKAIGVGWNVTASSENFSFLTGFLGCKSVELSGKVTANVANPAALGVSSGLASGCQESVGTKSPFTISNIKVPNGIKFFSGGTGEMLFEYDIDPSSNPNVHCHGVAPLSVKWESGKATFHVEGVAKMTGPCGPNWPMSADMRLFETGNDSVKGAITVIDNP